ncbi:MAG: ABC transporter substrate-binding protein [Christensenella sp.]|uniref:ABC transporter substrate-binding protein n=1 Tax=Christensenella sp. TaxID=1935934 RepID=UPI002B1F926B|nr:ABC transporter substrate-binding protein [Christensenella sp.]MEA5003170.1 ABC transporter substrate-binding protein [Christensenella sp.]
MKKGKGMWIRIVCIVLIVALIIGFTGCGQGQQPAQSANGTQTSEEASGQGENGTSDYPAVTIEYWNINSETQGGPTVEQLIQKFNETNDKNITVVGKFNANAYQGIAQNLQAELAIGEYPGVVQVGWNYLNYFAENFPQYVGPKEIIEKYVPEDAGYLEEKLETNIIELGTAVNGEILGLPYAASTPVVFYNADIFREAGLDPDNPPETFDEWLEAGQTIKDKTGKEGLYYEIIANTYTMSPMIMGTGTNMYEVDANGQATATFYSPESVELFKKWQAGFDSGACIDLGSEEALGAFAAGGIATQIVTIGKLSYMQESCDFDLRTAPFPRTGSEEDYTVCVGGNMLVCFSENEDEIRACWEFMKFLYEADNMADWVVGTGYLPVTKDAAESEKMQAFLDENQLMQASLETWTNAKSWPSWPGANGMNVDQILVDMRDSIVSNGVNPDTALKEAQDKINSML